ncbi:TonB-dependent receptor domain-containing protein [Aurantiacibacter flavus]|uniref:TonB-dependent receptor n=1 Tax=Aurantiacibacter flavus TaxID=3145232 RepID=A0ABV0CYQ2_9SPHN
MTTISSFKSSLRFSAGLAVAIFSVSGAQAQEVDEEPDSEYLGTIDIGESTRAIQTNTATPVTKINREEIEDRQAGTIAELLDSVPGVTLINGSTPIGSGINIRGFGANGTYGNDQKINILIDGASTGAEEIYRVGTQLFTDPLLYKSVQVIRGPVGGFEYGSGAVGGTIVLETIDAYDLLGGETGITAAQTLGLLEDRGESGWNTSTTVAAMPNENFEFLANYTYRKGGTRHAGDGSEIGNSEFSLPSFLVKAAFHFGADNAHTVKASYTKTENSERDRPYDSFGTSGGFFGNVDRDTEQRTLSAGYYFNPLSDLVDLSLEYTYADQQIDQQAVPAANNPLLNADLRYETTKVTLKNGALFTTGPVRHAVRAGLEYISKDRLDASSAPGGTDERFAAFLIDEIELARGFTITPALRYEQQTLDAVIFDGTPDEAPISLDYDSFMGGVSARYELPFGLAVFGSWAKTESFPILDDIETVGKRTTAELGTTWEGGLSFNRRGILAENDNVALKVNYYNSELTDVTSQLSNAVEIDIDGFEIEASYATASGFYIDMNGNIVDGTFLNASGVWADWNNMPASSYRLAIGKRFGFGLDLRWEGRLVEDLVLDGTLDTEGYNVHDIRLAYSPDIEPLRNITFRLALENVFDEFYTPALATRPAPGRTFKAAMTFQF